MNGLWFDPSIFPNLLFFLRQTPSLFSASRHHGTTGPGGDGCSAAHCGGRGWFIWGHLPGVVRWFSHSSMDSSTQRFFWLCYINWREKQRQGKQKKQTRKPKTRRTKKTKTHQKEENLGTTQLLFLCFFCLSADSFLWVLWICFFFFCELFFVFLLKSTSSVQAGLFRVIANWVFKTPVDVFFRVYTIIQSNYCILRITILHYENP